jgi:phage-related protein
MTLSSTLAPLLGILKTVFVALGGAIASPIVIVGLLIGAFVLAYNKCEWFRNGVNTIVSSIIEFFKSIPNKLSSFVTSFQQSAVDLWNGLWNGAKSIWNLIVTWITTSFNNVVNSIRGFGLAFTNVAKSIFNAIWNGFKAVWTTIFNWVKTIFNAVIGAIKWYVNGYMNVAKFLFNAIWNGFKTIWNSINNWISTIFNGVVNKIKGFASNFTSIGKDLMNGLWNGLKSIWGDISGWFDDKFGGLVDTVKNIFKIKSPSRVMAEIGMNVGEGFKVGLDDQIPNIDNSIASIKSGFDALGNSKQTNITYNYNPSFSGIGNNVSLVDLERASQREINKLRLLGV